MFILKDHFIDARDGQGMIKISKFHFYMKDFPGKHGCLYFDVNFQ